jgi:hypothetical protein
MKILSVPLTQSLNLAAGSFDEDEGAAAILPLAVAMFDQLLDWLSRQTSSDPRSISASMIGIGATALCLRWGTYLAVLLDEHKPLDPRVEKAEISMISDSEIKRINLEFSANLARLIRLLHEDQGSCYRLLGLAYHHLAMPRFRFRQCPEILDVFDGLTSAGFWNRADPDLKARMKQTHPIVIRHPYRVLSNSLVLSAYRNGPVEDLHFGLSSRYALTRRRATEEQSRDLMCYTSVRLAPMLSKFRPWELRADSPVPWPENLAGIYISPRFTCRTWSLTESGSRIDLQFPADRTAADS